MARLHLGVDAAGTVEVSDADLASMTSYSAPGNTRPGGYPNWSPDGEWLAVPDWPAGCWQSPSGALALRLRAPTATELALLLGVDAGHEPGSAIVAIDHEEVIIGSRCFLLPASRNAAEAITTVAAAGQHYTVHAASWGPHYVRYHTTRPALERALGRELTPADVDEEAFGADSVSFDRAHLLVYAAIEMLGLALLIAGPLMIRRLTGRWWPAMLTLAALYVAYLMALPIYVPRLSDADFFYQRIVGDFALPWGVLLIMPVALGIGLTELLTRASVEHRAG